MAIEVTVPEAYTGDFEVIPADAYPANVYGVEPVDKASFKVKGEPGEDMTEWKWGFELSADSDYPGRRFSKWTSRTLGEKSNARKIVSTLLGRSLEPGEVIDLESLIGLQCKIVLSDKDKEGNPKNSITDFIVMRQKPGTAAKTSSKPTNLGARLKVAQGTLQWNDSQFKAWYGMSTADNGKTRFADLPEAEQMRLVEEIEAQAAGDPDLPF